MIIIFSHLLDQSEQITESLLWLVVNTGSTNNWTCVHRMNKRKSQLRCTRADILQNSCYLQVFEMQNEQYWVSCWFSVIFSDKYYSIILSLPICVESAWAVAIWFDILYDMMSSSNYNNCTHTKVIFLFAAIWIIMDMGQSLYVAQCICGRWFEDLSG